MSSGKTWTLEIGLALLCICCQFGIWKLLHQKKIFTAGETLAPVPAEVTTMTVAETTTATRENETSVPADTLKQERQYRVLDNLLDQEEFLKFAAEELSFQRMLMEADCEFLVSSVTFYIQPERGRNAAEERIRRHEEALQELEDFVEGMDFSGLSEEERQVVDDYLDWRRQWAEVIYAPTVSPEEKLVVAKQCSVELRQNARNILLREFRSSEPWKALEKYNQLSYKLRFDAIHRYMYPPGRIGMDYTDAEGIRHCYSVKLF